MIASIEVVNVADKTAASTREKGTGGKSCLILQSAKLERDRKKKGAGVQVLRE